MQLSRSWLVVPADDAAALDAASGAGADVVVADLDAVAVAARPAARKNLDGWLAAPAGEGGPARWSRAGTGDALEDDVQVLTRHRLAGLMIPHAANAALLVELDHILGRRETAIAAVIETAVGLLNAGALAAVSRVSHLVFGEEQLRVDLGVEPSPDDHEIASLRGHLVVLSAAFGKFAPIGPAPATGATDDEVAVSCAELRRAGYGGRLVVDPAHVAIVNDAFAIAPEKLDAAEQLVARFEKAIANGEVLLDESGRAVTDTDINAAYRTLGRRPGSI